MHDQAFFGVELTDEGKIEDHYVAKAYKHHKQHSLRTFCAPSTCG